MMEKNPLVSILIPAFNVENYLPQCLDSILSQTYQQLQVVVIDDGSTDGTWNVCQDYVQKSPQVEAYHQENNGVGVTRNNLLGKISGELFLFVDADDWIEPDMVSFLVERMYRNDVDMVVCTSTETFESIVPSEYSEQHWDQDTTIREFLRHQQMNGSLWNKLMKTSLIQDERFHREISYGEDALFCWHLIQRINGILVTNKQLYHYRMNDQSLSHQSYGSKKQSGHLVWKQIAEETAVSWPRYAEIATANYAISDMWQIYYAAGSGYPKDAHIKEYQRNIRNHLLLIYKSGLINRKKMLFATVAAFSYNACKWFV